MIEIKVAHNREELEKLYQWWTENGRNKSWEFSVGTACGLETDIAKPSIETTDYPKCYKFTTSNCIYVGRYIPNCYGAIK